MALFIDVARDNPAVAERRAWIEPFWAAHGFDGFIARGLLAEHALWRGDTEQAAGRGSGRHRPPLRRRRGLPAVRHPAGRRRPERPRRPGPQARAAGDDEAAAAELAAAEELMRRSPARGRRSRSGPSSCSAPRAAAGWPGPRRSTAGPAATTTRRRGRRSWTSSGPRYVYETARTRWRLAEALAEAGRRDEAAEQWRRRVQTADKLGGQAAAPGARRPGPPGQDRRPRSQQRPTATVLAGLTSREREVLRLWPRAAATGRSPSALFIAPKTASVHVSNILGKLGAASRTEAAAIAHREGLISQPSGA